MTAQVIDGFGIAKSLRERLKEQIAGHVESGARPPCLAVVLVGDDAASAVYVRAKEKAAAHVGIRTIDHRLPADTSQDALVELVQALNHDDAVDGILVQLPLPAGLCEDLVLDTIDPNKDVDGFHPHNIGRLSQNRPRFVAATPSGCMKLLTAVDTPLSGANAVVVGRSNIVGKPMAMLLTNASATVTVAHSRTKDLPRLLADADVVIAAVGRPRFIEGAWLKPGCTVIDVGINRLADKSLVGDVDFEAAKAVARAITPVPRGVGPMTIACLLENTFRAATA